MSARPRVLQVLQPLDGGAAEHVLTLSAGLAERGFEVDVATPAESAITEELVAEGIAVHELPLARQAGRGDLAAARTLRAIDSRGHYAIVHAHSSKAGALVRAVLPRRGRLVYTPHCFAFATTGFGVTRRLIYRGVEQALVPRSARIVAVCEWERAVGERALWGSSRLLRKVENGVPPCGPVAPDTALVGFKGCEPLAAMISGLRPPKDPLMVVRAAELLERRGVAGRLAIVGEGDMRGEVVAEIERLGLGKRVRWFPYGGRMQPYLAALDIAVLCSDWEALPLSVLEAMSCGLPVVATRVGGVPEAVVTGRSGMVVDPGDAPALADALGELFGSAALREQLGAGGRSLYESRFTSERMVDQLAALYRELV